MQVSFLELARHTSMHQGVSLISSPSQSFQPNVKHDCCDHSLCLLTGSYKQLLNHIFLLVFCLHYNQPSLSLLSGLWSYSACWKPQTTLLCTKPTKSHQRADYWLTRERKTASSIPSFTCVTFVSYVFAIKEVLSILL